MATTNTSNTSPVEAARKRKRAQVSYYSFDIEDDSACASDDSVEEYSPVKKHKRGKKARNKRSKKRAPKEHKPAKSFPFLSLPPELRNLIYVHALSEPGPDSRARCRLHVASRVKAYRNVAVRVPAAQPRTANPFSPALLATCRQVHGEASRVLYGQRVYAADTFALHAFLAQIGRANRALLRSVTVLRWGRSRAERTMNFPALTLLAEAVGLESLVIASEMGRGSWGWGWRPQKIRDVKGRNAKRLARHLLRSGGYWLEAVGRAKGKRDAGVEAVKLAPCNFGLRDEDEDTVVYEEEMERFRGELRKLLM